MAPNVWYEVNPDTKNISQLNIHWGMHFRLSRNINTFSSWSILLNVFYNLLIIVIIYNLLVLILLRSQSLTISIWTWMGSSTSVPTPMTKMSTFASRKKRFLQTSSITWRCSSGSLSPARSSSWLWMVWRREQRWTSRGEGDSGRHGCRLKETDWNRLEFTQMFQMF